MDSISIRYGESVTLPLDTGDPTAVSAVMYIGKPGEVYTLSQPISLVDGKGVFVFTEEEMELPLDTYFYQINVIAEDGSIEKYPSPEPNSEIDANDFPQFEVREALDVTEVS